MRPSFHDKGALMADFDAIRISLASPEQDPRRGRTAR